MHKSIKKLCDGLDEAAAAVLKVQNDSRRIPDLTGQWHNAALNRDQLADIPSDLSARLRAEGITAIPDTLAKKIEALADSVGALASNIIPNLFGGNSYHSVPSYLLTMQYAEYVLNAEFGWRSLPAKTALPNMMAKRLAVVEKQLSSLEVNSEKVQAQLNTINSAYEAADNLPTTTSELQTLIDTVSEDVKKANELLNSTTEREQFSEKVVTRLKEIEAEAKEVVKKCEDAYRIATTTGLAGAFDARANSLSNSMWLWVAGLLCSLAIGGLVGFYRVSALVELLRSPGFDGAQALAQVLVSAFSVGAPIWFAWIATKQIGQRFRLSEDYAYKATLAKAYEGYRNEALRVDKKLSDRLFAMALERLDEPPLRLVELDSHGSPFHELRRRSQFWPFNKREKSTPTEPNDRPPD